MASPTLEFTSVEMTTLNHTERTLVIADAIRAVVGEDMLIAGDYTIVPVPTGDVTDLVVSKAFINDWGHRNYADIRIHKRGIEGAVLGPDAGDRLSIKTAGKYLLGAAQTIGVKISLPEAHQLSPL